jgi:chromosome segregation ATPase
MSEDLTQQWLGEIQALKQQLADATTRCDEAWESAEKWRKLYNTEAEQRRTDAQLLQQEIASLKAEIKKMRGIDETTLPDADVNTAIHAEISQIDSVPELQAKLVEAVKERASLLLALKTEQESHAQTRNSLTTALGDAIDGLARVRTEGK